MEDGARRLRDDHESSGPADTVRFDSGFYDYDENWCFLTLKAAQSLAGTTDVVNVLEFRLENPERAGGIARQAEQMTGQDFLATTWMEQNFALFRALRLEKLVTA